MTRRAWQVQPCIAVLCLAAGCGRFGNVNQGLVIDYDRQQGTVRIIQDSNYRDPANPRYDVLPPIEVRLPQDPREMGPAPDSGKLLRLDYKNRQAVIYDARTGAIRTASFALVAGRNDGPCPEVDRAAGTVAVCDPHTRRSVTLSVADEYLELPADTWQPGDQVRYYYKEPGRALRFMNVTKTDLTKTGK